MGTTGPAGRLNTLDEGMARATLARCCGARRWVEAMLTARPFASDADLFDAAERVWWGLGRADWLEAFAAHPRIGDRAPDRWSQSEQAGVDGARPDTLTALAQGNRDYEKRFGYVFLISATGKGALEMLGALERRLAHDPDTELLVAATEQANITRLRLDRVGEETS
jgi:OHCU decarboxylase